MVANIVSAHTFGNVLYLTTRDEQGEKIWRIETTLCPPQLGPENPQTKQTKEVQEHEG